MAQFLRWLAVGMLTVAVFAAAGCSRQETPPAGADAATQGEASGGSAVPGSAAVGVDVGMTPPPFTLKDVDGRDVSLSDFQGKVVVLDLWATWCPPCRQEIPFLVGLYEEFRDRGLVVVGIGLDDGGADVLRPFAAANKVSYPVLVGDKPVAASYKVSSIPMTFVIGPDGRIAAKHVGFTPAIGNALREEVVKLIEGAPQEV